MRCQVGPGLHMTISTARHLRRWDYRRAHLTLRGRKSTAPGPPWAYPTRRVGCGSASIVYPMHRLLGHRGELVLAGGLSVGVGLGVATTSVALFAAGGIVIVAFLVDDPRVRALFVIVGGISVLQSSPDLTAAKGAYLVGVGACVLAALASLARGSNAIQAWRMRPLFVLSILLSSLLTLSFLVALSNGIPVVSWARDAAPYVLLATVPVFAMDLRSAASDRALTAMILFVGIFSTLGFLVRWGKAHGVLSFDLAALGLTSQLLIGVTFSFCAAAAITARDRRVAWATLAAGIVVTLLVSGTRSTVTLLVVPLAIAAVLGHRRSLPTGVRRLAVAAALAALALTALGGLALARLAPGSDNKLITRLGSTQILAAGPAADVSFQARANQLRAASQTFANNPVLGTGLGYEFEWLAPVGGRTVVRRSLVIDSGAADLAKFGILGVLVALAMGACVIVFLRRTLSAPDALEAASAALIGVFALTVVSLPFTSPFTDKGLAFGLMLLIARSLPRKAEVEILQSCLKAHQASEPLAPLRFTVRADDRVFYG